MPFSISGLRTELLTDPAGLGYSGQIALGDHAGLALVLNDRSGAGAAPVCRKRPLHVRQDWNDPLPQTRS